MIDHFRAAWDEILAPGTMFEMTETEVRGIPMRVFAAAPPSMRSVWELTAGYADRTYVVFEDERYTYADIDARVRALAHVLREQHGVGSGDRVAIAMRNYPEWVISYWAILATGAAAVGMNAWWTGPEMQYALGDSQPKVLIADGERVERVLPMLDELRAGAPLHLITTRHDGELPAGADRWDDVVDPSTAPDTLPEADIDPDDDATIFYTSGTTGFPKGAQLTHRGCVHNLMHIIAMGQIAGAAVQKAAEAAGEPAPDPAAQGPAGSPVIMAPTPLFHVTANNCLLHPATIGGGTIVLTYKWDPGRALELIEREKVTNFSGVPTMSRELLTHPDWSTRDTSSIAAMGGGGAPMPRDLVGKIGTSLKSGAPSTGYGLTETCGIVTGNSGATYLAKPESAGPIVPTLDAKVVDEEDREVAPGEPGRLLVRGPIVIKGYLNKPEATAESIRDGWFDTGDIARLDEDGFVYIVDRAKDMVLRGGENVYCSEVEAAIYELDGIAEVAVFGVPDERLGEEVAAAVVLAPGTDMDADGLRAALKDRIANHKIPAHVWFLDEQLPRNANGKFVKRELRDRLVAEMA
ncbi:class I adenylate-forming enzyme family protein [Actinomarinicola tropica]|uniref:AMP-binding protein n=1 Tax=Actinomarinicola tropica TaxID=2789776 RepID=A0A5Q2RMW3_9ACTN|nr:class I adenylate-forming enzyme family protein [Actinomarinicola tropica]QGG96814.1 AMP-binding protein [Actinomarinicola tropica]